MKPSTVGRLEMLANGRTICPAGYREPNITQGMVLVGRTLKKCEHFGETA
jgi:hypothetical protein